MTISRIAITTGEPAGIGPDICLQLATRDWPVELVLVGNHALLQKRAEDLALSVNLKKFNAADAQVSKQGELSVLDIPLLAEVTPGQLNSLNGAYVVEMLKQATHNCLEQTFAGIVTAPVQKSVINDAGIPFTGHTEFFAELCGTPRVVMMLTSGTLRVALATTHLPLRDVADAIDGPLLDEVISILHQDLKTKFGIQSPKIQVCGLNPHAGEGGHLGREEIEVIEPALEQMRQRNMDLVGPVPADTAFNQDRLDQYDAVLAMYHDQGLPTLKHHGFGEAINITLGLPIIRTSVDHGTALDLAGTGQADAGSLFAATQLAVELAGHFNLPKHEQVH